jgi:nucleotide-binding universal stress UspA family protein
MYTRILIVLDRHPQARAALRAGLQLAHAHEAEATLLALQARLPVATPDSIPPMPVPNDEFERAAKADANRALAAAHRAAARAGVAARCDELDPAPTPQAIAAHACELGCRLIVVASEGRNAVTRLLAGSLAPRLITAAAAMPVLVCRDVEPGSRERPAARRPRRTAPPAA